MTISAVRALSFSIYTRTKDSLHDHNMLNRGTLFDVSSAGGLGGALSGAVISVGSARGYFPVFVVFSARLIVSILSIRACEGTLHHNALLWAHTSNAS